MITAAPTRQRVRLTGFDYARMSACFVTLCAREHRHLFGWIEYGRMYPNDVGREVERAWHQIPGRFPDVELDAFVLMPNHLHGILLLPEQEARPLTAVMGWFKSAVTRELGRPVWQRGCWDRQIQDDGELNRLREHIDDNPMEWGSDPENPLAMLVYR
jgi:REP element-mobilizing transposase RayT